MYKILFTFLFLLISCERKAINHEVVFKGDLGIQNSQIGSNIPILKNYTNRQGLSDSFLIDIPVIKIFDQKIYIADSYNKKISIFSTGSEKSDQKLLLSIPNKGEKYEFSRPYDLWVDSKQNIFVLASILDIESYEVQSYNNQTADIKNYNQFEENLKNISNENYYIYQFTSKGEFVRKLGNNGVNSSPIIYPSYLSGDNRGNVYIGFTQITNDSLQTVLKQYDEKGSVKTVFDSLTLNVETNINSIDYTGTILSVQNFKNKEELALMIEYQPRHTNENTPITIDQIKSTIVTYDLETKSLGDDILSLSNISEVILDIDQNDRIYLQSFGLEENALKVRVIHNKKSSKVYYTPINSSYYSLFDYFIDNKGNLYNSLVNRNTELIVLQWHIEENNKSAK